MSASLSPSERSTGAATSSTAVPSTLRSSTAVSSTLRVEAVFRDVDEQQAHAIAAEMISRAHELANLPECECDVDVNVQVGSPEGDDARDSGAQ